ncbi:undecaprenyl-diphosphatase [Pseudoduganella flava]|uniref:Phosphatase PAP2 family protein n=1 Tax=Pseudoduganella flava TaxID=871742 RepID=A0A562Q3W3_9BURK|nr:phosphatase PAP2 family protein [Pseudoduganella flava]QGZ41485.1 phosphatase PAP2 family protein [Pseudoduganella flava]TWI51447.1 undecaprenyl-diphosphatase [Pseudoduganella flava]
MTRLSIRSLISLLLCWLCLLGTLAHADTLLDRRTSGTPSPLWRHADFVSNTALIATVAGAIWLGSEDGAGRAMWQGAEGFVLADVAADGLKRVFGRERPSETDDPGLWFKHGRSFPSGHVASTAAAVTPLILEFADEYPAVWLLAAVPAYEMVSRVETRSHWQTDVLAGLALGVAVGYVEHRHGPWTLRAIPGGVYVGFRKAF